MTSTQAAPAAATARVAAPATPVAARPARRRPRPGPLLLALPVPALVLVLWTLGVQQAWELPFGIQMGFLPTPLEVGRRLVDLAAGGIVDDAFSGTLLAHLWASTQRVLAGFALAVALAVPLGVVMGRFDPVFRMLEPTVNLARPIPVTAWAPLTLLIIGYGDASAIFLVFLAAFFPVLLNTISGVRQVPVRLLEAAAMLGTRPAQVLYKVVLPASMRSIASGLRVALGLSWVILVVGETVGINTGLGAMITQARDQSKTDLIVAGMVVIGLCGFVADRLLTGLLTLATRGRPTLT
ncbi:ABC transporter permease [Cellulomonas hominis]|jgi:NitT/TauT family transport system permease protein|uniref:Binding-protein-dependent transport system inner membrane protein n=1 Tax=Cellulomonas hominis TaxID=156981 RepID=A0A511F827_9CELL|nr:ABC transporter permease [Cellulomonas hominis]MBB5473116.1 NitT/TauT family transport system permease protein [Cellulomonas hominis]MBU5422524.1 ABC transporter permease [Cellulomonas hominis]NKY10524.1 ABC transporter permease [Cellulomonas hominis]GEL45456.1 binding-protein-dependent transport system inner membrane protein [Cellulomonas hominis]